MKQFILPIFLFLVLAIPVSSEQNVNPPKTVKVALFDMSKYLIKRTEVKEKTPEAKEIVKRKKVLATAKQFLGVRYQWGGDSKKGIDCSGFTKKVYKNHNVKLARTARKQFKQGKVIHKPNGKRGDLIFFSDSRRPVGHVGIIIDPEKKLMIHASSGANKVTITNYNKPYYRNHYVGIRRLT